ncbi:MAG: HEPN domain-containing protein [Xanthobacteraceae bacterium]
MRTATLTDDPKLARIAAALREAFGARLASALLFGSRARGDHRPDSDYDVAVLLKDLDREKDRDTLDRVRRSIGEEAWTLQFWPLTSNGLAERTTLAFNIRNDAVPLPGLSWPAVVAPPIAPDEGPMKPETSHLLEGSDRELARVKKLLQIDEHDAAARDAYQAALFAARALIFELRGLAPKTHSGTSSLFAETAIKPGLLDERHSATLTQGMKIRAEVDYEPLPAVTKEQAITYIESATDLVEQVKKALEARG